MIIGNKLILSTINKSVENKTFSHSYIFSGNYGLGKKTIAEYFAKTILCETNSACGICPSCVSINNKNNPDIVYVKPTKKSLGVQDIRSQVIQKLNLKPYKYDYKIFILENCETITIESQNALLKSIEEPPDYAIFFLITENLNNFLNTILSRCIILKVKPVLEQDVFNFLISNTDISNEEAKFVSNYSDGNIGFALDLIKDEDFKENRNKIIEYSTSIGNLNLVQILKLVKSFDKFKDDIEKYLNILILFYRDVIVFKSTKNKTLLNQQDKFLLIKNQSELYNLKNLYKKIDAIIDAKKNLNNYANFNLTIEVMLLKIKEK